MSGSSSRERQAIAERLEVERWARIRDERLRELVAEDPSAAPCAYCGEATVERYSAARAEMGQTGYYRIHAENLAIGGPHVLGREECEPGSSGWGAR